MRKMRPAVCRCGYVEDAVDGRNEGLTHCGTPMREMTRSELRALRAAEKPVIVARRRKVAA